MKTVMVIGASGFLGANLVAHFKKRYRVIAGFNRSCIRFPGVTPFFYMLSDRDYMKRVLGLYRPEVIIFAAGVSDFVECHKRSRQTEAVNTYGPVVISAAADTLPHRFIYLSSAFVYDGKKGNFLESDVVLPQTVFGKQKLAGENYVRSKFLNNTIFRFSPIFGMGSIYHPSIFDRIRFRLERGLTVEMVPNEVHSFLSLRVAIQAIEWAVNNETANKTYNLGGLTKLSWYDFARTTAESLGFNPDLVVQAKGQFEQDMDFSLNGSEIIRQLQIDPLVLEQGLDLFKQELVCS